MHFFTPRQSNNHRSFGLNIKSLAIYLALFLCLQIGLEALPRVGHSVLSYATNVTVEDLLKDTNQKRQENGLSTLALNDQLSQAAKLKGENMFAEQYWAHTSPTGKTPWSFFNQVGYTYLYAGENLARDFADSAGVVDAWMNSPSHRENLLNSRYHEIGFAVVNGKYGDSETTVVIQVFGAKLVASPTVAAPGASTTTVLTTGSSPVLQGQPVSNSATNEVLASKVINPFQITKISALLLGGLLALLLVIDAVVLYRKKAIRVSGHNVAHFLLVIAAGVVIFTLKKGSIL